MIATLQTFDQDDQVKRSEISLDVQEIATEATRARYNIKYQVIKVDRRISMLINTVTWTVFTLATWTITGQGNLVKIVAGSGVLSHLMLETKYTLQLWKAKTLAEIGEESDI